MTLFKGIPLYSLRTNSNIPCNLWRECTEPSPPHLAQISGRFLLQSTNTHFCLQARDTTDPAWQNNATVQGTSF